MGIKDYVILEFEKQKDRPLKSEFLRKLAGSGFLTIADIAPDGIKQREVSAAIEINVPYIAAKIVSDTLDRYEQAIENEYRRFASQQLFPRVVVTPLRHDEDSTHLENAESYITVGNIVLTEAAGEDQ